MLLQDMVSKAMPYLPLEQRSVFGFSLLTGNSKPNSFNRWFGC